MAQYQVLCGCGHESRVSLYGPENGRQRRLDWMRSPAGQCNPCYAAMKRSDDDKRDQEALAALIAAYKQQLPDGTPAQLAKLRSQVAAMDSQDVRARAMTQAMTDLEL